jgi:hypothetical protein
MKQFEVIIFFIFLSQNIFSQSVTIYGNVTDSLNGENLTGATLYVADSQTGTTTNEYGFFSLTTRSGNHKITVSYLGYKTKNIFVNADKNKKINIQLSPQTNDLEGITVFSDKGDNIKRVEAGVNRLSSNMIKTVPAMMGEVDVIKAIQLLPGVQTVAEGSSSFSVRGGGYDQNLILLDETPLYSSSHLLGFFSIFNNDVVKDVQLYKGDIPANFGGRLSSLMDVRTKDGNNRKFGGKGAIGTISSKLTLEGPIFTPDATFVVAGRRTYADLFLKLSNNQSLRQSVLYFYDFNAKINYKIGNNDRIYLAGYFGRDKFKNSLAGMDFGNKIGSLRWNHIFSSKLFFNLSFMFSDYDYSMNSAITDDIAFEWTARLKDLGGKLDFTYNLNSKNTVKFGYQAAYHSINPGEGGGYGNKSMIERFVLPELFALEQALYVSHQTNINSLTLRYGLRASFFSNLGNDSASYNLINYNFYQNEYIQTHRGKIFNTNRSFEPRISINYQLNKISAIKSSYSHSAQYMQIASNSTAGSPLDLWFYASQNVKPQLCDQFVVGYFRNFFGENIETSFELYYKNFQNIIDFKERASLLNNPYLERELRFGRGYSYGFEVMISKPNGKLNGWINYTFSRSFRKVDEVNNGEWFRSPYDKPHSINVVANYEISRRWSVSASWIYSTGMPVTYPEGRYQIGDKYVPIPSKRNAYRFPDYHRLDLSATFKLSKPQKRFQHELNLSIYNAYARKNPWTIYFTQDKDNPNHSKAMMIYLFSIVPSITWNFEF